MKFLCGVILVLWAETCHGSLEIKDQKNQTRECELYGGKDSSKAPPITFHRRISVGVIPQEENFHAELQVSSDAGRSCRLYLISGSITATCTDQSVSREHLSRSAETELWMEVAARPGGASPFVWDLKVVARQGQRRAQLLLPDTGLQPPVTLRLKGRSVHHYYNCITGCLFKKSLEMSPGDYTFFLRYEEDFVLMTLDCGWSQYPIGSPPSLPGNISLADLPTKPFAESSPKDDSGDLSSSEILKVLKSSTKRLSINVTASELGPPGGLKKIEVVWNTQTGNIGVLVDGAPVGDLLFYGLLKEGRQVKVKVEGGGLVSSCDPQFQSVAYASDDEVAAEEPMTTTTTTTKTIDSPATFSSPYTGPQPSHQTGNGWLVAVFTFVFLNFLVTVAIAAFAVKSYFRSSSKGSPIPKSNSESRPPFIRQFSTCSSIRSSGRGSQRRKPQENDALEKTPDNRIGKTNSKTTTPLTPTDSLDNPEKQRNLSTDEFVELSLV